MFTFLGIILIIASIAMLIMYPSFNKANVMGEKQDRLGNKRSVVVEKKSPAILLAFNKKVSLAVLVFGIFITLIPALWFYAQPGVLYAVQYPWGGDNAVTEQGVSFKGFGKLIPIQMEIPIRDILPEDEGKKVQSDFAYILTAKEREFNDAVKGNVANSIVINVDYTAYDTVRKELKFLNVAKTNRSQENLVFSRIVPFRDAVLKNTAKLMSAQEYISGGSSEFDRAFKDQLKYGMYILEEVSDNQDGNIIGENTERTVGADNDSRKKVFKIKYKDGEPLRNEGGLSDYGLTVQQAVIDKVDWETNFDTRLDKLKEIVAETQTQKITAEKERYRKQAVIEAGEASKAEEQAKLEKEQIKETITAETEVKKQKLQLEAEKIKYDKSLIEKKTRVTLADAKKYEIDRADGLSEREKFVITTNKETAIGVAAELKSTKFPEFMYFGGGSGGSGTAQNSPMIYDLLGAKLAESMFKDVSKD